MTIPPTIDLAAAAARRWDTIVIGAGPAGALAARQLAQRGLDVLLIDRAALPRWKVCGACLNADACGTLAAVGLDHIVTQHHAIPLESMHLAAGARWARIKLTGRVALSREALDAALVDAAVRAGASLLTRTAARLSGITPSARRVALRQDGHDVMIAGQVVIAATGLAGMGDVRHIVHAGSRIGAGTVADEAPVAYRPGVIYMACGSGGYVGLVRVEDGRLNVACAMDTGATRLHGIGPLAAAILAETGLPPVSGIADLPWRGTPMLTRRAVRPAAERLFLIGDAAGYVEPFTGDGIAWALAAAVAVTPLASRSCRGWHAALAADWSACHRRIVQRRQRSCHLLAAVLRRPMLTRGAIALLHRAPALAAPLLRMLDRSAAVLQASRSRR